jgi:protein TonB
MGHPAPTDPPVLRKPVPARPAAVGKPLSLAAQPNLFRLDSLVFSQQESHTRRRSLSFASSLGLHSIILAGVITLPLLIEDVLPEPGLAIRGFFVSPPDVAPPPPPPPPPAAAPRSTARPAAARPQPIEEPRFVAPIEIPEEVQPSEELLDLGVEGGVPGGVEGGVPGGVLGGVVGGLPQAAATPPPAALVRVGGVIRAPKLIESPRPEYPLLATQARVSALLILEAEVGPDGRVRGVKVLRGHPLFDESAMTAVRRWRYQPLLLNGVPTPFLVTVTVNFNLKTAEAPTAQ